MAKKTKTATDAVNADTGMTAGEIRAALDGVPDEACPRVRIWSLNTDGGLVQRITVETTE